MKIGGMQPCSFSDYPGKVAAVLFTQGCNFRCPFCHNGSLLSKKGNESYSEEEVFTFLKMRKGKLDGVVITGGEPTQHRDLPEFIRRIKQLGFLVKLDTNGSNPSMVEELLEENLIDYLAMDIKAPLNKYDSLCGVQVNTGLISKSISIIGSSKVAHHFRTTNVKPLLKKDDFKNLLDLVPGNSKHITQPFISENAWQPALRVVNN
jgi:pyruvate formate lyase activating enzyme